jgi:2-polyprenyl-6-hydroxyphenyl methylase / 3-demethylubiquinone-9 3-methyltransferase
VIPSTAEARTSTVTSGTASADEVARFAALADAWWDPNGAFRPLHRLNPVRVAYVRDRLVAQLAHGSTSARPLAGLSVLDVGCGGGLLAEPLTRLGARVTGIDADAEGVAIARSHAAMAGLAIDYAVTTPEDLVATGRVFDAVVSLEVVEHVTDPDAFLQALVRLTRPGGALVMATISRTLASLALAKIAAEYVLRWVPAGTHSWAKFVKPSELAAGLRRAGATPIDARGMTYDPLRGTWSLTNDLSVNYLMAATVR